MAHIFKFRGPKIQKEEAGDALVWKPREGVEVSAAEARIRELGIDPVVLRDLIRSIEPFTGEVPREIKEKLGSADSAELAAIVNRGLPIDWKTNPEFYKGIAAEVFRRSNSTK